MAHTITVTLTNDEVEAIVRSAGLLNAGGVISSRPLATGGAKIMDAVRAHTKVPTWSQDDVDRFLATSGQYESVLIVTARRLDEPSTWRTLAGSVMQSEIGDWHVTERFSSWTVKAQVFEATYVHLPDGRYRKTSLVHAARMTETAIITTLEGTSLVKPGNWIVRNETGESWPMTDDDFTRFYELTGASH